MTLKAHRGRCAHCGHDHDAARKMAEYRAASAPPVDAVPGEPVASLSEVETLQFLLRECADMLEAKEAERNVPKRERYLGNSATYVGNLVARCRSALAASVASRAGSEPVADSVRSKMEAAADLVAACRETGPSRPYAPGYYATRWCNGIGQDIQGHGDTILAAAEDADRIVRETEAAVNRG